MKLRTLRLALAVSLSLSVLVSSAHGSTTPEPPRSMVVVSDDGTAAAARHVRSVGGRVTSRIDLIGAVVAQLDPADVAVLEQVQSLSVTPDRALTVEDQSYEGTPASTYPASVGATKMWDAGARGQGVGIALLDTGVSPHPDLAGRLVSSADLTREGDFLDNYGHGTFLAGLIAGDGTTSSGRFTGVAPGAHLMSVKVAGADGATTLGQVLYGLQLIDSSKDRYNIRVVNIALAGPAVSGPDPLVLAVERLWADGLVVVAAAGNSGPGTGSIASPAVDPYIVTVGSTDEHGTPSVDDDTVPSWSARGPSVYSMAKPDLVAPGKSLVSLRAAGSSADHENPQARVGDHYFRGSGTSMSAAIASGAAALLLQSDPSFSPDEVKGVLMAEARPVADDDANAIGAGAVDVFAASSSDAPAANQDLPSLGARTAVGAPDDPVPGAKESSFVWSRDPMGGEDRWLSRRWAEQEWTSRRWASRRWASRRWADADWSGDDWSSRRWAGKDWASRRWAGQLWAGADWASRRWAGTDWASVSWATAGWR